MNPPNQRPFSEIYLEWVASGGTGQLTVNLEVQRAGYSFQSIPDAQGRGPSDKYKYTGDVGATYLFRATVTDSNGKSIFDTLQVST